ncbi:hypothetical protein [uncultured Gilvimarinus sp.]|uniref:hypothetical protein n=1 Tax=uncultured Gilvimarinus sp. TaxID=1689143 RepID=UPI0030EBED1C
MDFPPIDISKVPVYTKLEVAELQLERALNLLLEEADYISSITLAGASEEILGKLLNEQGQEGDLEGFVNACVQLGRDEFQEDWPKREFVSMANYFRNGLKHYTDGDSISVPEEAAVEILNRAINNYWKLTSKETELIKRFMGKYSLM